MTPFAKRYLCVALGLAAAGLGLSAGGCTAAGFVANAVVPPITKAQYVPPKTQRMLVLVENRENPGMSVAEADCITSYILDDLAAYEVCPLLDAKKLHALRDAQGEKINKLSISQIGKALGARQVLYVDIQRINVGSVQGVPQHGRMDATVRIVDVERSATVWPTTGDSAPISVETPLTQDIDGRLAAAIREALLRSAALSVSRLYHDTNRDQI